MLKRLLADRRPAEDGSAGSATAADDASLSPVAPDPGERRLGWLVTAIAIVAVVVLAATLSRLPGLRGSVHPSAVPGAPAASWAGDDSAGHTSPGPAGGTPTGSVAALPPAGGPGDPEAPPAGAGGAPAATSAGQAAAPTGPAASTAPGGTAGPATTTPAGTDGSAPDLPRDVQTAIADLGAEIRRQVNAGQLDATAGDDLRSKVQQVAREVSEGDWAAARYYAGRIGDKLGKYLDDGTLTSTGYQALISRLAVLDEALS